MVVHVWREGGGVGRGKKKEERRMKVFKNVDRCNKNVDR